MSTRMIGWKAFLIFATIVTGGQAFGDVLGLKMTGLLVLIIAAANAATEWVVQQTTISRSVATPNEQVIARQPSPSAPVLATPAAAALGIAPGTVVDVNPTGTVPPGTGPGQGT